MLQQRYTRLPRFQQLLVSVLLGSFAILLLNSLFLLLFDRSTAATYMIMVLMHVILGTLLVAPILLFIILHLLKMPIAHNRGATAAGIFTALSLGILLATGFALVREGASQSVFVALHIVSTCTTVVGFLAHVSLKRGVRYHFLEWTELWGEGLGKAVRHPLSVTLLAGLGVSAIFFFSLWQDSNRAAYVSNDKHIAFAPGQAVLAHEGFLKEEDLGRSDFCGQAGCHPDIYKQWNESTHHFSSFNNPIIAKVWSC
jgi:hypothetical protein